MKQIIEDSIEQIKSHTQKPKPVPTAGIKDQLDPGKMFTDVLRQATGYGGDSGKKVPTKTELERMQAEERNKAEDEMAKIKEQAGIKPEAKKQPVKGNVGILISQASSRQEVPAYIKGKEGYDPEKQLKAEQQRKNSLPPLAPMSQKPKQGSWTQAMERKKHGAEVKGGRE